jgi:hypothetical protein
MWMGSFVKLLAVQKINNSVRLLNRRIVVQPDKLPPAFQKGPEHCALVFSYYVDGKLRQTTCSAENKQQCEVARGNLVVIKGNCLFP